MNDKYTVKQWLAAFGVGFILLFMFIVVLFPFLLAVVVGNWWLIMLYGVWWIPGFFLIQLSVALGEPLIDIL
jgi:hypothetical protein